MYHVHELLRRGVVPWRVFHRLLVLCEWTVDQVVLRDRLQVEAVQLGFTGVGAVYEVGDAMITYYAYKL